MPNHKPVDWSAFAAKLRWEAFAARARDRYNPLTPVQPQPEPQPQHQTQQDFTWDRFMVTGGRSFNPPKGSRYSLILTQAFEQKIISEEEYNSVDTRYLCDITMQIMDNPTYDTSTSGEHHGSRFDRTALVSWVAKHSTNPETRQSTKVSNFIQDTNLKKEIDEFMNKIIIKLRSTGSTGSTGSSADLSAQSSPGSPRYKIK